MLQLLPLQPKGRRDAPGAREVRSPRQPRRRGGGTAGAVSALRRRGRGLLLCQNGVFQTLESFSQSAPFKNSKWDFFEGFTKGLRVFPYIYIYIFYRL